MRSGNTPTGRVHPSRLADPADWPHVEDSWRRILGGPGRNQFILTNEAVTIQGDIAGVTLDENLVDVGGTGTVAATNVYARARRRWRLVVHHGSPVLAAEPDRGGENRVSSTSTSPLQSLSS